MSKDTLTDEDRLKVWRRSLERFHAERIEIDRQIKILEALIADVLKRIDAQG